MQLALTASNIHTYTAGSGKMQKLSTQCILTCFETKLKLNQLNFFLMLICVTLSSKRIFQTNYRPIQKHLNLGETQFQILLLQPYRSPAVNFLFCAAVQAPHTLYSVLLSIACFFIIVFAFFHQCVCEIINKRKIRLCRANLLHINKF